MKKRIAAMVLAGAMALSLAPAYGVTAKDHFRLLLRKYEVRQMESPGADFHGAFHPALADH